MCADSFEDLYVNMGGLNGIAQYHPSACGTDRDYVTVCKACVAAAQSLSINAGSVLVKCKLYVCYIATCGQNVCL